MGNRQQMKAGTMATVAFVWQDTCVAHNGILFSSRPVLIIVFTINIFLTDLNSIFHAAVLD